MQSPSSSVEGGGGGGAELKILEKSLLGEGSKNFILEGGYIVGGGGGAGEGGSRIFEVKIKIA